MKSFVPTPSRSLLAAAALGVVVLAAGCTVSVKTQTKYVATSPTTLTSQPWTAQAIEIENANGSITVNGDPAATAVTLVAKPFAFADNQTDGNAAANDVAMSITLDEKTPGQIYAHCNVASTAHGTAANGTTGCEVTVTLPSGSATQGVRLKVTSHNGPVTVSNVNGVAGQQVLVLSDNGSVDAENITGGVKAHTENGSVTAAVNPTTGSNVEASTPVGDVSLSLPSGFATDRLTITATQGKLTSAFTDVTATSTSRGTVSTGASSIIATTGLGNVALLSH